jgi:hypothetical protein
VVAVGRCGGDEPFQPRATGGRGATSGHVRGLGEGPRGAMLHQDRESQRQSSGGGGGRRGQGGGGRWEEGHVEEAGAW